MAFETLQKAGTIPNLGVIELQSIAVTSGETSKIVSFKQIHKNPLVLVSADYDAGAFVTDITDNSCTVNFTNPAADKNIFVVIIG